MSDDETIDAVRGWVDELCRELGIPSEEVTSTPCWASPASPLAPSSARQRR